MQTLHIIKYLYPCIVTSGIIVSQTIIAPNVLAQISTDNTVGTKVEFINQDQVFTIRGGQSRGGNLFHSFEQFSVPNGTTASFQNYSTIKNIINRVTGPSLSNIEGIIRANGVANFILINPNGITFGANAQINIKGSFLATTAEGMIFADGVEFSSNNVEPNPMLTMSSPVGLQFGSNPGTIVNQAKNLVPQETSGVTFAFVGGDLDFLGAELSLNQGRVELGSVGKNSQVRLSITEVGFELAYQGVNTFQDVTLSEGTKIEGKNLPIQVTGRNIVLNESEIKTTTENANTAGNIIINAFDDVTLSEGTKIEGENLPIQVTGRNIVLNESEIKTTTENANTAGNIIINAFDDVTLSEGTKIEGENLPIQVTGRNIVLNESEIKTTTENANTAGNIIINALESFQIIGGQTLAEVGPNATGNGGDIVVNTKNLLLREGAAILSGTGGIGDSGSLEINASESIELIGTSSSSATLLGTNTLNSGNGGSTIINTKRLMLQDGGQIQAITTMEGNGGTIDINATEFIQVSGSGIVRDRNAVALSRITTESGFEDRRRPGFSPGGNVNIETNQLSVTNGGVISAASLGLGNAGNVNITANSIFLDNQGSITASSEGTGNAGNLTIDTNQLTVNNGSEVAVRSIGIGQGGNLTLNAQSIFLDEKSQLTATTEPLDPKTALELGFDPEVLELDNALANAGSLTIITDNLTVNNDSEVTVSSFGLGNAGNVDIQAQDVLLDNNSRLSAETASGEGGNINLDVEGFLSLRRDSDISTTAGTTGGLGNGGNIDINALFILTVPAENSDIFANAFLGSGGNINIDVAGVFGIEERERLTPLSDITASSQFGQVGNIGINRPDVDPQRSLVKLPDEVVDTNNLIVDACRLGEALTRGEFTIEGRGGLPSNPNEGVENPTGLTELGYPNIDQLNTQPTNQEPPSPPSEEYRNQNDTHTTTIVEAQGWIVNADGNVVLTAKAPTVTPQSPGLNPATCHDLSHHNSSP
ncbi:S-layer family protein [Crocosphaera sp. Alani8]|uniref:S-layer family protein n=1 Tax=Crocosphaera sp. Alani8 TaxID=3038952 RepID=UPI00313D69EC